jgi:hypothetical protein
MSASRGTGLLIITAYAAFTASVLASGYLIPHAAQLIAALSAVSVAVLTAALASGHRAGPAGPAGRLPRSGQPGGGVAGPPPWLSGNGHRPPSADSPAPGGSAQDISVSLAVAIPLWAERSARTC